MSYAVDIETIPDLSMVDFLPDVKPDKRLTDACKIAKDIEIKKQEQISKMSLNPIFAKVICISMYNPSEEHILMGDEGKIIKDFWDILGKHGNIFTYNGKSFDMPVIIKRGLRYNIGNYYFNSSMFCDRYKAARHIDIMEQFCGNNGYEKLDTLAKVYLGKTKNEISFSEFPELLKTTSGQEKIGKYCLQDAKLTWELAEKMGFMME